MTNEEVINKLIEEIYDTDKDSDIRSIIKNNLNAQDEECNNILHHSNMSACVTIHNLFNIMNKQNITYCDTAKEAFNTKLIKTIRKHTLVFQTFTDEGGDITLKNKNG